MHPSRHSTVASSQRDERQELDRCLRSQAGTLANVDRTALAGLGWPAGRCRKLVTLRHQRLCSAARLYVWFGWTNRCTVVAVQTWSELDWPSQPGLKEQCFNGRSLAKEDIHDWQQVWTKANSKKVQLMKQLTVIILIVDHRRVIEASIVDDSTRKTLSMGVSPEKPVPWPAAAFVLSMAARNRFVSIKPDCHYCNAPEKRLDGVPPTQQEQFCRQCRCLGWQFVLDHVRCVSVFNECRGEVGSRLDLGPELVRAEFPILAAAHCPFASPGPDRHFHPVCIDRPPSHALYNNVVRRNPNENSISGDFRHKLCRDCSVRFAEEYAARWPEAEPLPPLETPAGELIALLVRH